MNLLSLGGGVQSTTLLFMALRGEIEPLEGVLFADTGWEPRAVYTHLRTLEAACHEPACPSSAAANLPTRMGATGMVERLTAGLQLGDRRGWIWTVALLC